MFVQTKVKNNLGKVRNCTFSQLWGALHRSTDAKRSPLLEQKVTFFVQSATYLSLDNRDFHLNLSPKVSICRLLDCLNAKRLGLFTWGWLHIEQFRMLKVYVENGLSPLVMIKLQAFGFKYFDNCIRHESCNYGVPFVRFKLPLDWHSCCQLSLPMIDYSSCQGIFHYKFSSMV